MDSKAVGPSKRIAMLASFCGGLQYPEIAQNFNVDVVTVRYIAKIENWVEKRVEFLKRYEARALRSAATELDKSIKICDSLLGQLLVEHKADLKKEKGSRVLPTERYEMILKILKTKSILLGGLPPGGGMTQLNMQQNVTLQGMSPAQLEDMRRKLLTELGLGEGPPIEGTVLLTEPDDSES